MEIKVFQLRYYEMKFLKLKEAETQSTGLFSSTSILTGNVSCSVVPDSLRPHGRQPARLLCPWSSGKKTGVGSQSVLQGNLPNPG